MGSLISHRTSSGIPKQLGRYRPLIVRNKSLPSIICCMIHSVLRTIMCIKMLIRKVIRCPPAVVDFVVIGCPLFEGSGNAHFSLPGSPVITVQTNIPTKRHAAWWAWGTLEGLVVQKQKKKRRKKWQLNGKSNNPFIFFYSDVIDAATRADQAKRSVSVKANIEKTIFYEQLRL